MTVALFLGFSSGFPLLLTISVLQAWMREEGVDLKTIGLFALVGMPYTIKFLWAPLFDRVTLPFLGRRRGWLLVIQGALALSIVSLGATSPREAPLLVAFVAFLLAFFSASQDIVIDAHRRENLHEEELGLGSSFYVYGYRTGMLLASGGGLALADVVSWPTVYLVLGAVMGIGMLTTLAAEEPVASDSTPTNFREAVVDPFVDYFRRNDALWVLAFILLYKLGDSMASAISTPFYLDVGFSKTEIGAITKVFGFWATLAGLGIGGTTLLYLGLYRSLWIFGILQALSTVGFVLLTLTGPSNWFLSGVIAFENLSGGMGTAAYMAFMASLTNRKFTATQYALLTSLMGMPRVILSAPTGYLATAVGWAGFFSFCALIAIPGLMLLIRFRPWILEAESSGRSLAEAASA